MGLAWSVSCRVVVLCMQKVQGCIAEHLRKQLGMQGR